MGVGSSSEGGISGAASSGMSIWVAGEGSGVGVTRLMSGSAGTASSPGTGWSLAGISSLRASSSSKALT